MTRVGVIGPQDPDSFADNIADCLPDLGVDVVKLGTPRPRFRSGKASAAYDFAARGFPVLDEKVQGAMVRRALDLRPDLIITTQSELMPSTVAAFRAAGVPVVLWFPDHIANLGRGLMFAADYSTVYFKDPAVVERATAVLGLPAKYLPEACNPHWHRPAGGAPGDDAGLVVAGNIYATRAVLLERLVKADVPLRLYGSHFPAWIPQREALEGLHAKRPVVRLEKAGVFRRAQAVLNNLHPSELESVNCRLFEAAGCGAAVLTEYRPALDDLFEQGSEVLAFRTYDELVKGWRALEDDPELGVRLGDAAARRAAAEHTYQHRLRVILEDQVR